jgi:hypothetical protein
MKMSSHQNFRKRLAEAQKFLSSLDEIETTEWAELTTAQQEDFVREMVGIRNIINATRNRYFEW